jgi:hypothetical protein
VPDVVWFCELVVEDAALAIAEPPSASAASAATPARTLLPCWNIVVVLSLVRVLPGYDGQGASEM